MDKPQFDSDSSLLRRLQEDTGVSSGQIGAPAEVPDTPPRAPDPPKPPPEPAQPEHQAIAAPVQTSTPPSAVEGKGASGLSGFSWFVAIGVFAVAVIVMLAIIAGPSSRSSVNSAKDDQGVAESNRLLPDPPDELPGARETIEIFRDHIASKNYAASYGMLSAAFQRRLSWSRYEQGFLKTESETYQVLDFSESGRARATAEVRVNAIERDGGRRVYRELLIEYRLRLNGRTWEIDSGKVLSSHTYEP